MQVDPNYTWQSFKADCSPASEVDGTTAKPGSVRVDVTGAIVPIDDLYVVVAPSSSMGNDFTSAAGMSDKDQEIFGKAQGDEQTVLSANNSIHLQNIVNPDVKTYPVPAWPGHMASLIQAKTEPINVSGHFVAEPKGDGTYDFNELQRVVPYKTMQDLTSRSKLPSDTVIVGSPEWDAVAAKMHAAAEATKKPLN